MPKITLPTLVNGRRAETIAVSDRGLAYGDGLFETMVVAKGKIALLDFHLQRLERGFNTLGFVGVQRVDIERDIATVLSLLAGVSCVVKLTITRGSGGRGYRPPVDAVFSRIIRCSPMPDYSVEGDGVCVFLCRTKLPEAFELAGLKHLNRLPQVQARNEWQPGVFFEGLMQDGRGIVVEATQANLFWLDKNILYTNDLTRCGVAGVARQCILTELAPLLDLEVRFADISYVDLLSVEAAFMSNSVAGIVPINSMKNVSDDALMTFSNSAARHTVSRLQSLFRRRLQQD